MVLAVCLCDLRNDTADRSKGFATEWRCRMLHAGDAERRTVSRTRSRPTEEVTDSELVDEEAQEIEARLLNARRQRQQKMPETGVVDSYGEVFGVSGLSIADGSVMPGPVSATQMVSGPSTS